jgi:molybdopterin synthase catalytic subunit
MCGTMNSKLSGGDDEMKRLAAAAFEPRSLPGDYFAIQAQPIDLLELVRRVSGSSNGAIATFSGVVRDTFEGRNVLFLEYEAFEPMALRVLKEIAAELRALHDVGSVAIVHRTGRLRIGEVSVGIAVSAPHRGAALHACAEAIERVKARLPVWKKEFFEGGDTWRENDVRSGVSPRE